MPKPNKAAATTPPATPENAAPPAAPLNDEFAVDKETGETNAPRPRFVPKIIRHVTVETLKIPAGATVYVKILEAMKKAKRAVGRSAEPATLLAVRNLETGKDTQLVVAVALRGILSEEFQNDSYIGKCFAITKGTDKRGQSEDRKYYQYTVDEIEDPEPAAK